MKIFALNAGSSSIKAALIDTRTKRRLLDVRVEEIGTPAGRLRVDLDTTTALANIEHEAALTHVFDTVLQHTGAQQLACIAHRIVHGGAEFDRPIVLDDHVEQRLRALDQLAPLHNPPALAAVNGARQRFVGVPQVAVFDTSFHTTMPARSRIYPLPIALSERMGLRRYGFHGTSHAYVAHAVARYLRADTANLRTISCHLGNGASVAAVEYGRSVDTSMGMTPLEGLVMGTRGGDLDPGVLIQLLKSGEFDVESLDRLLNKESGLKGLTGTNDLREVEQRAADGDESCRVAINLYAHRLRKYLGAYAAVMGGVDVIAFTGGVGENSTTIRARVSQRLEFLGAVLDEDLNRDAKLARQHGVFEISARESRVKLLVVAADEELAIACEAALVLEQQRQPSTLDRQIPIAVSARHAHLSQATLEHLFGSGYQLSPRVPLSQPGQYAATDTVTLVGPRGRLERVRLMGPPRNQDQIEISRTDEFHLGIDAPVRLSGDLANTPGITVEGPKGSVTLKSGVICARRHIHMHPSDAQRLNLRDRDVVAVRIDSNGRDLTFGDVIVRVSPEFKLEMHLDTDEANAAEISQGEIGELYAPHASATVVSTKPNSRFD